MCIVSVGCSNRKSSLETVVINDKAIPMMHTEDVSTLISDSGITRYRLNAKVWDVYTDSVAESYWYFPEGIYVEQFDSIFNVEASLTADTAYHYERQKLWKVIGNIKIVNLAGEKFETSELFWNEKEGTIYTDKFIRIQRRGQLHTGYGLRSNQNMSDWSIVNHAGEIDMPEESGTDTIKTDSINKIQPVPAKNSELQKR